MAHAVDHRHLDRRVCRQLGGTNSAPASKSNSPPLPWMRFGAALGTRSANHWICCRKSASSHLGNLPGNQPHDFVKETRNIVFLTMFCAAQNTSPDPRQRPPQGPRPHTPQTPNRDPPKDLDPRDPGPRGTVGAAQRPTQRPRPHGPGTPETRDPPRDRDPRDPGPQRPTQRPSP